MSVALVKREDKIATLRQALERAAPKLRSVLPGNLTLERINSVAMAAITKNPALADCTPASFLTAIHQSLQLGLEPGGPLNHAYLVPYGNVCQLIVGYQGLVELARRSGLVSSIRAEAIYARDQFRWQEGMVPVLEHTPYFPVWQGNQELKASDFHRGQLIAVYSIALFKDGVSQFSVMTLADLEKIRTRSRAANKGPWVSDYDEMCKKSVIRRLLKLIPKSSELAQAMAMEDEAESGRTPRYATPLVDIDRKGPDPVLAEPEVVEPESPEAEGEPAESPPPATEPPPPSGGEASGSDPAVFFTLKDDLAATPQGPTGKTARYEAGKSISAALQKGLITEVEADALRQLYKEKEKE